MNKFDPNQLPELEAAVTSQIENGTYDFQNNLLILRLYRLFPDKINVLVVVQILIKALMNLPQTDFTLCLYLLPINVQEDKEVAELKKIHQLLETAKFTEFWSVLEGDTASNLLKPVPSFVNSVRQFIANVVTITYQSAPKELLAKLLNFSSSELEEFISSKQDWKVTTTQEGGEAYVAFPITEFNQARQKKQPENVDLTTVSQILSFVH